MTCRICDADETVPHLPFCPDCYESERQKFADSVGIRLRDSDGGEI